MCDGVVMFNKTNFKRLSIIFVAVCVFICSLSCWIGLSFNTDSAEHADAATYDSYYAGLDTTKEGTTFRTELATLIKTTHKYNTTYGELIDVYPDSDADPNKSGNILWFYTGTSVKAPTNFNSGTNREHVWPKNAGNAFPEKSDAGSDAHHLRPCNTNLNSTRSNNNFGEVATTVGNIVAENGTKSYDNPAYQANSVFYPGEGYRGATARILMYVQTRWGDQYSLSFVLGQGSNKTIGDIEDLMKWHIQEPPTAEEIARNEAIYKIQGNRNPFIDHPEYAEMIYCNDGKSYNDELQAVVEQYGSYLDGTQGGTGVDLEYLTIEPSYTTISAGQTTTLTAVAHPDGASNEVTWSSSNSSVATVDNAGVVTGIASGTANITATSTRDSSIKASIAVTVKAISAVSLTGNPIKVVYNEGDKFNPTGITVTATYTDGSTEILNNDTCQWLDGTTRLENLSEGTTSVVFKFGVFEKTVDASITVNALKTQTLTITRSSFTGTGGYDWTPWSSNSISGLGFMFPGNSSQIQMNSTQLSYYIFNTTPLPGGIQSITIKASADKNWEIRTSTSAFSQGNGNPTTGTSRGTLISSTDGGTLTINTTDQYFAICYKSTKAVYIDEIIITYGTSSSHVHTPSDWITDSDATCNVNGAKHTECTECGEIIDVETIPAGNHTFGNWAETTHPQCGVAGEESRTCTVCGNIETRPVSATGHSYGPWTPTYNNKEERTCSVCGNVEQRNSADNAKIEEFSNLVTAVESAEDLTEKWNAISSANTFYETLTPAEKESVVDEYNTLLAEINEYNTSTHAVNAESKKATHDAIMLFAGTLPIMAFAVYFLMKA